MPDSTQSSLKHEAHLVLDQPILRLPYELSRKNFKVAQASVERDCAAVQTSLKDTATASLANSMNPDEVLQSFDSMISRMQALKRKLVVCSSEEERLQKSSHARIQHLAELYKIPSVEDDEYTKWSQIRLDRLLVDYLLQKGYCNTAIALAQKRHIDRLVDIETFLRLKAITDALMDGRLQPALAWCSENKKELKRLDSRLEFEIRCQQFVELVRSQDRDKLVEAISYAKKSLLPMRSKYPEAVQTIAGLLAFGPDELCEGSPYEKLYSEIRWGELMELFVKTHNTLLSLPNKPILQIALSAGLSALKTPACHSELESTKRPFTTSSDSSCTCPICSRELNQLAQGAPFAFHTSSKVDPDSVMLPNSRVYGRAKLENYAKKAGLQDGLIKDLVTGELYSANTLKKVYLS